MVTGLAPWIELFVQGGTSCSNLVKLCGVTMLACVFALLGYLLVVRCQPMFPEGIEEHAFCLFMEVPCL